MENINTLKANLSAIGNAIRGKLGVENKYRIEDMPAAINSISGGKIEPSIITASCLVGSPLDSPHNDWDKVKDLIDYENATYLHSIFAERKDLTVREVEEFLSHSMPNMTSLSYAVNNTTFIDSDIETRIVDLTLDSPNCTNYESLFGISNIRHLKITVLNHNADFSMSYLCDQSKVTTLEIKGPGLNHLTSLYCLCRRDTFLKTVTIGDNNTNYSKVSDTGKMFEGCSNLKTLTIKGVNVLPLTSTDAIPSTITRIVVPSKLADSYRYATNWSAFSEKLWFS